MEELYEKLYGMNNAVVISGEFLSEYLADTKPEYLKVFIFYLWKGIKEKYSIDDASGELDLEEDTIEQALKYWIRKKMIKKECLIKSSNQTSKSVRENIIDLDTKKKELIDKNRKDYSEVEQGLLFVAEKLIGKTLSERQVNIIEKCYNEYKFDESVIQYLLEYCSNNNKPDARYIGAVAASWYENNITDVASAKKFTEGFKKTPAKQNKANTKRTLDRKDDYWTIFTDSVANGKFK